MKKNQRHHWLHSCSEYQKLPKTHWFRRRFDAITWALRNVLPLGAWQSAPLVVLGILWACRPIGLVRLRHLKSRQSRLRGNEGWAQHVKAPMTWRRRLRRLAIRSIGFRIRHRLWLYDRTAAGNILLELPPRHDMDRLELDFGRCSAKNGWHQWDTEQDASYFGIWVHFERREILTYAEGDLQLVRCRNDRMLQRELDSMAEFYGPPPVVAVSFDEAGQRTDYIGDRPTVSAR